MLLTLCINLLLGTKDFIYLYSLYNAKSTVVNTEGFLGNISDQHLIN